MNSIFKLREVQPYDHEWLVDLHNDPQVLQNLTNPNAITLDQHMSWWNSVKDNPSQIRLIFEVDGNKAGFTKFYSIDNTNRNCVLGADLHVAYRGKGLAKHMWKLMIDFCYADLDLHRVSLTTAEYNAIAIRTYLGLGFKEEGRLKQSLYRNNKFWDQICMYKIKNDI
jgi:RimJ/RimL family protein N-acetyltransferase